MLFIVRCAAIWCIVLPYHYRCLLYIYVCTLLFVLSSFVCFILINSLSVQWNFPRNAIYYTLYQFMVFEVDAHVLRKYSALFSFQITFAPHRNRIAVGVTYIHMIFSSIYKKWKKKKKYFTILSLFLFLQNNVRASEKFVHILNA